MRIHLIQYYAQKPAASARYPVAGFPDISLSCIPTSDDYDALEYTCQSHWITYQHHRCSIEAHILKLSQKTVN